jgi:hypothetical protein
VPVPVIYLVKTAYLRIKVGWPGAKLETLRLAQAGMVGRRQLWVFLFSKCVPRPLVLTRVKAQFVTTIWTNV